MAVKRHFKIYHAAAVVIFGLIVAYGIITPYKNNKENQEVAVNMPPVVFYDSADQPRSLDDFKGGYVLVNLWATWCPPCVVELPALGSLQARLRDKNFKVVAISMDRTSVATILSFLHQRGAENLEAYWDKDRQIPSKWSYEGLPVSYLLNPEGRVLKKFEGAYEWDKPPAFDEVMALIR